MTLSAVVSPSPPVLRDERDDILTLTLDRPVSRNALSEDMIAALHAAIDAAASNHNVRAVILAANGPAFCAGHDLKQLTARRSDADGGRSYFATIMNACSAMMQAIIACPKPVIAAVGGVATAAGCQIVATSDLAVASSAARFATPGVDIGLFCTTPMVALSRNVPRKQAMEMLLTGEPITAERALQIGLVNQVVDAGGERAAAMALAAKVARKPSSVIALGKAAFHRQNEMDLSDAYRFASEVMVENMMLDDAREGIGAFIEKREPKWEG